MAADLSQAAVDRALRGLGVYRVQIAQDIAADGERDAFSGALLLALGLRETVLQNINNPAETDHGCFQISELYHAPWLRSQPGCPAGSWRPEPGRTALEDSHCPRFTPACEYALAMLKENYAYAEAKGVSGHHGVSDDEMRLRFAVAAYNAGVGGAMRGYRDNGHPDTHTTGGDYGDWVIRHRSKVNHFLARNPNWRT